MQSCGQQREGGWGDCRSASKLFFREVLMHQSSMDFTKPSHALRGRRKSPVSKKIEQHESFSSSMPRSRCESHHGNGSVFRVEMTELGSWLAPLSVRDEAPLRELKILGVATTAAFPRLWNFLAALFAPFFAAGGYLALGWMRWSLVW